MPKIVLDPATFKVLASDTRLDILRMLDGRPRTVSELGRDMRLNKATVFEHLQVLVQAELIQKIEREGSKWVYYKLNWKGQNLLHPENTTIFVLLGIAGAGLGGAILQLGRMLEWWLAGEGGAVDGVGEGDAFDTQEKENAPADDSAEDGQVAGQGSGDTSDSTQASEDQALFAERPQDDGAGADGSGWTDWLDDARTWTLALLALIAVAAAFVTVFLWRRAKRLELIEHAALVQRVGQRAVPDDAGEAAAPA
jgi:DNA-binding transcriptional ArsR family regulator